MSSRTPITEVSAPSGRRRWVYGRLDPGRGTELKLMALAIPADTFLSYFDSARQRSLMIGGFPVVKVPGLAGATFLDLAALSDEDRRCRMYGGFENSSTLSVDRRITAAEYRKQGIL